MQGLLEGLVRIQRNLTLQLMGVERNHQIPGSERHENVVEHTYGAALMTWYLYDLLGLKLNEAKLFKYILVHDLLERGQKRDVNTYADPEHRAAKKLYEAGQAELISAEFPDFPNLSETIHAYEERTEPEAVFVDSAEKMQALVLAYMDGWRPYRNAKSDGSSVSYAEFCAMHEGQVERAHPALKSIFQKVLEAVKPTYFDQPMPAESPGSLQL